MLQAKKSFCRRKETVNIDIITASKNVNRKTC